jgi:hypothetical protein
MQEKGRRITDYGGNIGGAGARRGAPEKALAASFAGASPPEACGEPTLIRPITPRLSDQAARESSPVSSKVYRGRLLLETGF